MAGEEGVGKWAKVGPGGDIYTVGTDGRGGGLWHAWLITGYAPGIVSSPARSLFRFSPGKKNSSSLNSLLVYWVVLYFLTLHNTLPRRAKSNRKYDAAGVLYAPVTGTYNIPALTVAPPTAARRSHQESSHN